jgi:hypothetical protein
MDKLLSSDKAPQLCGFNVHLSESCETSLYIVDLQNDWKLMGVGHHS